MAKNESIGSPRGAATPLKRKSGTGSAAVVPPPMTPGGNVLRLVPLASAPLTPRDAENAADTIEVLRGLLRDAVNGHCIGIAFAAIYQHPKRSFIVNAAGECHRSHAFALGMVDLLAAYLRDLEKAAR